MSAPKKNSKITLPIFGSVVVNVPDFFVLPSKTTQGKFKLVKGLTPTGRAITTREGHKAIRIKSNEENQLYLEEESYGNPKIEYGMFSPKDQKILRKYFIPPPNKAFVEKEDGSVVSELSFDYDYPPTNQYINNKRYKVVNESLRNDIEYEAKQRRKKARKAKRT